MTETKHNDVLENILAASASKYNSPINKRII